MSEPFEGVQPADRAAVELLAEVSEAMGRGVEAALKTPGIVDVRRDIGPYLDEVMREAVQAALGAVVPSIIDEHDAEIAQCREDLRLAHKALQALLTSSESEVDRLTAARDRAVANAERTAEIKRAHWEVAQRLRGAFAVALSQRDNFQDGLRYLNGRVDLIREAAGVGLDVELPELIDTVRGMRDRIDQLRGELAEVSRA